MHIETLRTIYRTRGELHHAFLLEGTKEHIVPTLTAFLEEELVFRTKGNPDFHVYEYDSFGIDDGRRLKNFAIQKPLQERKIFVTVFHTMTREAQNALLKLFEEPTKGTHFFLVTPRSEILLPTLRSRLFIIHGGKSAPISDTKARSFLSSSKAERIAQLKPFIEEKNKAGALQLLHSIEELLYKKLQKDRTKKEIADALVEIARIRGYLLDRSSSLKLLLEHVALAVPNV